VLSCEGQRQGHRMVARTRQAAAQRSGLLRDDIIRTRGEAFVRSNTLLGGAPERVSEGAIGATRAPTRCA
jgi:hypothetical protein